MSERLKRIILFIIITFGLSWSLVGLYLAFGGQWNTTGAMIVATLFMFMPMIAAILIHKVIYKLPMKQPLGISFKINIWWLVAWLLPLLIALVTIGVSLLFPDIRYSPEMTGFFERLKDVVSAERIEQMKSQMDLFTIHYFWIALIQGLIAGVTINAVAGFGEELGWRGFLLKELDQLKFWPASLIIGLIWGIWHAPIILQGHNYPQHPVAGVFMMIIFCLLLAPIFTYIRIKSKSVVAAAILHGSLNATVGLSIIMIAGGSDLTVGVTGFSGFIVLLIVNLLILLLDHKVTRKTIGSIE